MKFNLQKLRYERLSRRVSQVEMAEALNIPRSSYYKREVGTTNITVQEFSTIISYLEIPEHEVMNFFTQEVPERELV